MRIKVISDLHFEFQKDNGKSFLSSLNNDIDILIIAGDLCDSKILGPSIKNVSERFINSKILYTLGNHEYYKGNKNVLNLAKEICKNLPNIQLLENKVVTINGQRFLGCTSWFKHSGFQEGNDHMLNDFVAIKDIYSWINETQRVSHNFLKREMQDGDIVITHHLPHINCVSPKYKMNKTNQYFVNFDNYKLVEDKNPKLWVYGHTHTSSDFLMGETRLICNPFGYAGYEINPEFKDSFIEV